MTVNTDFNNHGAAMAQTSNNVQNIGLRSTNDANA